MSDTIAGDALLSGVSTAPPRRWIESARFDLVFFTLAPLVIKNLVLIGVSGGEYGIRGFIDAYDAATGTRKWRFYTIPAPGEPGSETWQRCPPDTKSFCDPEARKQLG